MANSLSKKDWIRLQLQLKDFGKDLGLKCKIPKVSDVADDIWVLYASYLGKIKSAIRGNVGGFINFGGDLSMAEDRRKKLEDRGCHTSLISVRADANGNITLEEYKDPIRLVELVLHEGFHRNSKNKLNYFLEEPAAYLMGYEGSINFFRLLGNGEWAQEAEINKRRFERLVKRFSSRYETRVKELESGEVINPSVKYNNAYLLGTKADFYIILW